MNRNAECLRESLKQALNLIAPGGRIAVISYQSREDAIVKDIFRRAVKGCRCEMPPDSCMCGDKKPLARALHKSVITPGREEMRANPRSRSAKLRVVERMDTNE